MSLNTFLKPSPRLALFAGCALFALVGSPAFTDMAFAEQGAGKHGQGGGHSAAGGSQDRGAGQHGGGGGAGKGQGLGGIFRDLTGTERDDAHGQGGQAGQQGQGGSRSDSGRSSSTDHSTTSDHTTEDDDSDRPEWAGQPGGKDGAGGGRPPTSGSKKGDLFGDLWIIVRDSNGVPILTAEGFVQPIAADGSLIPLDEEGHPIDETLTQEVELGRLNVGRAPASVLDRRAEEVITLLNDATDLTVDPAGRLVLTIDGEEQTIDSPLENLAIYVALMTDGTIPGVADLPGTEYDYMIDGVYTADDLAGSVAFLAAATDKTGAFTPDEIAYIDAFLDINTASIGNVVYSEIDYSGFTYDREATFGDRTVEILVEQPDGSYVPTEINIYDTVFESAPASGSGDLTAYTLAADDARTVVNYIHEFEVPSLDASN